MAKYYLRVEARKLRAGGNSLKDIARRINVSQSSVSLWCRDIRLSKAQVKNLLDAKRQLIKQGLVKGAKMQHLKRTNAIKVAEKDAKKLKKLKSKEFFMAGLALYLAEGTKTYGTVQFTNSDQRIIKFMIKWFNKYFNTPKSDIKFSVHINEIHRSREKKVLNFWKSCLNLKMGHFNKIRYVKTLSKKKYANHDKYYGTIDFRIKKSTNLLYKLNALTDQLLKLGNLSRAQ